MKSSRNAELLCDDPRKRFKLPSIVQKMQWNPDIIWSWKEKKTKILMQFWRAYNNFNKNAGKIYQLYINQHFTYEKMNAGGTIFFKLQL